MITLVWYTFSGRKQEVSRDIARGSRKASWQRDLISLAFVIEAVIELIAAMKLLGLS